LYALAELRCSDVFLVEDIECRQADVRDFLLTESNYGTRFCVCDGTFAVGDIADAPPPIAKDIPAAPNAGKAIFRRFRFETCFACAIEPSYN
jgi:hypothetical protein